MSLTLSDPYGALRDPGLPAVGLALDPDYMERRLADLPGVAPDGEVHLRSIRVLRHKPGRRCLIEYEVDVLLDSAPAASLTLLGKLRAGHRARSGYRLLDAFRCAGFDEGAPDGVAVPEPIGVCEEIDLWLQQKVPGREVGPLLAGPGGTELAARIAEAAYKVHRASIPPRRRHGMAEELAILHNRLEPLAEARPALGPGIARLLDECDRLGASLPAPGACGIHRDFYADQVLVDGDRLYLIDFDLYCLGDPGVDIGNFLGHLSEQALRETGDADALADVEDALRSRYAQLAGQAAARAADVYAALTLARHVWLSTLFEERRHLTAALLALARRRVAAALPRRTAPA